MTRKIGRARDARRAVDKAASTPELREIARALRDAIVDAAVAVAEARAKLECREAVLAVQRHHCATAQRRGRLAGEVGDPETEQIAARCVMKHGEQIARLEREVAAGRAALADAERDVAELREELIRADRASLGTLAERNAERAWRALRAGGGARPGLRAVSEAEDRRAADREHR
jgi:hypothetical protein